MSRTALSGAVLGALVAASLSLPATPAQALQAPVAFTSQALPTWQTNGVAWSLASAHGLVFVGGTFSSIRPPGAAAGTGEVSRHDFAVLSAGTGNPTSCAPSFEDSADPASATIRSLDVSPDGKTLYVGGLFDAVDGVARTNLAALDIASCTVTSFAPQPNDLVRALVSTSSQVYAGGDFTSVGGTTRHEAAGFTTAGDLTGWAPGFNSSVNALALNPDSSLVVVGGAFTTANDVTGPPLVVVNATTGANSTTFPTSVFPTGETAVKALAVDASGFYVGNEGTGRGAFDGRTAISWSGLSKRWTDSCLGATQALVVDQGLLYSGSHAHDCSSMGWFPDGARHHLLAESVNGPAIEPWFPNTDDGVDEEIGPRALALAPSGDTAYLWSAGEFMSVNGVQQEGLTRFGQGRDTVGPSAPLLTVTSSMAGQAKVAWRPSIDDDDARLTYHLYRDGKVVDTIADSSFFWSRPEIDFVDAHLPAGSHHGYVVTVTDGTSTASSASVPFVVPGVSSGYAAQVDGDGAAELLRYDEPGNVLLTDASGHRSSAFLVGSATFRGAGAVAGDPSSSLQLTGTASYLYSAVRVPAPSASTEETWFSTTSAKGGVLLDFGENQSIASLHPNRQVFVGTNGTLSFGVLNGSTPTVISSPKSYNDGHWHHVAATQGSDGMTLYVDGRAVAHNTLSTSPTVAGYWRIGHDADNFFPGAPTNSYYQGSLDETAFYARELAASTIAQHFFHLALSTVAINVGKSTLVTVQGAPGDAVQLLAYSRPSTTYKVVRTGTVGTTGRTSFTIAPRTNTRMYVHTAVGDSLSAVVSVRPAESLKGSASGKVGTFTGELVPGHGGVTVRLFTVRAGRITLVGTTKTDSHGAWRYSRTFSAAGSVTFIAQTVSDATNLSGQSNRVTVTFR